MTYTVKEKNGKFHLYNTSTKRMLSRSYNSPVEAKASITRLNKRGQGVKKYHSCCRNHGCGKKGKKKATAPKVTTPAKTKKKLKKKRRVALTQVSKKPVNNFGSGMTRGQQSYQQALKKLAGKASRLDALYNNIAF